MPTANRGRFIPDAIAHFLKQDYKDKELIIVDDGDEPVADLVPDNVSIHYIKMAKTGDTIGTKRNYACSLANGDIIMHWDDDDWYAQGWISKQVSTLQNTGADICGLGQLFFYDPLLRKAWKYVYPDKASPWVAGATMAYRREIWMAYPFRNMQVGEDNDFVWYSGGKVFAHGYINGFVSRLHRGNTSPKHTHDHRWHPYPIQDVLNILRES
jgi:glycosyltransferase involved in cell wall biosynthesis